MMRFELVTRTENDARQVMAWRNDPDTLRFSFHTAPKVWPAFASEFDEYFAFPDLPPLFVLLEDQRIAFLRFDSVADPIYLWRRCCSISINVAPECRGKGLGTKILKEVQPWIKHQGYDTLYAEIKIDNESSFTAFTTAGFARLDDGLKILPESGEQIPIRRCLCDLTHKNTPELPVKIVAEIGSNWRMGTPARDMEMARKLIDIAVDAGADAVKFQLFRPETIYVPNAGSPQYLDEAGISTPIQDLFVDLMMQHEMLIELHAYCLHAGIEFMATPFSPAAFSFIDPLVNCHKIASYEIGHVHLLQMAAASKKPIYLSTGAATIDEIDWAVNVIRQHGGTSITLLQCTASYPAPSASMNLRAIPWLKQRFNVSVGLSDHSRHPTNAPVAAVALGATVIEKHFTLHNKLPGPDHAFALLPDELKAMVAAIREAEAMRGAPIKIVDEADQELRLFACRGIQAIKEISAGDQLKEGENIAILRPGNRTKGIHARFLGDIEGRKAQRNIPLGEGLQIGDYA